MNRLDPRLALAWAWCRPIAAFVATLVGAAAAVVLLVTLAPGNAMDAIGWSMPDRPDGLCLECPWYEQVAQRLGRMAVGDFGVSISYRSGADVTGLLIDTLPRSLAVVIGGLFIAWLVAAAAVALRRRGRLVGRAAVTGAAFATTVPAFLVAVVVWRVAATALGLDVGWQHLIVAAALIGIFDGGLGDLTARIDAELRLAAATPHVRAARVNGDRPLRALVLTVAGPLMEIAVARFSVLLGAVMLVEIPLRLYGMGQLLAGAAASRDIPVVAGCMVAFAAIVGVVHLAKDLVRLAIDPRLRRPAVQR